MAVSTDASTPGIVMVARGTEAVARVLGAQAVLGRTIRMADGTTLEIDDDRMSREHASVRFERGHWVIADHESRNGTFVNGQRITGEVRRRGDTTLRLGHSVFVLLANVTGHPVAYDEDGPELARAYEQIRRGAASRTLLLHAEAGIGTERAARAYHDAGPRRGGPFVPVSCPSMPEGVAERLLFGAKKGVVESIGHFQMARGGTIFLDDVAALAPNVQSKLLRLIDRGQLEPVGATEGTPIEVGIVAGAHAELRLAVGDDRFDPELYQRLSQVVVPLPALRERRVDIARLLVREIAACDPTLQIHAKLVESCLVRPWPGNEQELQLAVRKAAEAARQQGRDIVRVDDLDPAAGLTAGALAAETAVERPKGATPPADLDRAAIEAALVRANGVVHLAARILGLHRSQLYQLMDKHGIVFTEDS